MARTINKSVLDMSIYNTENRLITQSDLKNLEKWSNIEQWEPGIVLDIILDDTHPLFKSEISLVSTPTQFPPNSKNKQANVSDKLYGDVGVVFIRLCYSQQGVSNKDLVRAYPLERECTSYPLLNEVVGVINYFGTYYYSNKINYRKFANSDADFRFEQTYGFNSINQGVFDNKGNSIGPIIGPVSSFDSTGNPSNITFNGVLGNYFWFNNRIRNLRRFEGDTVIESRFGQSIRFGSYDDNRKNDVGSYDDYKSINGIDNPYSKLPAGGGNPMILIRNRQRPVSKQNTPLNEVNVGGYISEDINGDGSSIHITSGLTTSKFKTTVLKSYFGRDKHEEQGGYSPRGCTTFTYPKLTGDQIVINSDRLIFQSRAQETLHYSKKRYMVVTDAEYTVDADKQIVFTTNQKTVLNSPAIYLGEYNNSNEPAILGQTCVNWLYDLCNLLIEHTHYYAHTHPHTGRENPAHTQALVQLQQLVDLRDSLYTMLSRRVFLTGGGYADGLNGGGLNGLSVTGINAGELSPAGIPGGWNGRNRRLDGSLDPAAIDNATAGLQDAMKQFISDNIGTMSEADLKNILSQAVDASLI